MPDHNTPVPIVVTHLSGVRFVAQIRSHQVVVDQPRSDGGEDTAPMPLELLGASLGSCIAYYVQQFLHARGLPHAGMRVEVEQIKSRNPYRISEFVARVMLPAALPTGYGEMLERVIRGCPAHNTMVYPAHVTVAIEHGTPISP